MKNANELPGSLRFGYVTSYDPSLHTARVSFPDSGITSSPLPVLTHSTLSHQDENPLFPGEHVACLMCGNGAEFGVILGAFYDERNRPPVHEAQTRAVTFEDGTQLRYDSAQNEGHAFFQGNADMVFSDGTSISYDISSHTLTADIKGSSEVSYSDGTSMKYDASSHKMSTNLAGDSEVSYSDDTCIKYDSSGHKLTFEVYGDVEVNVTGKYTVTEEWDG